LVAELFLRYGPDGATHIRGMFAAAIWDTRDQHLHLVRDAVGARALYYAESGTECWFAARLRALRRAPIVSGELSLQAVRAYLAFAYVPGALTLWRDVLELRPGTVRSLPEREARQYWEPREVCDDPPQSMDTHARRLRVLLESAVGDRLPKSGPTGVFLSGGLDSSLVAALVQKQATGPVHTYSIHFGAQYPSELQFSEMVARHCGTAHHVLELPAKLIQSRLPETLAALDDPIGDPLTVPNFLLGREAARDVPVVFNGEGGDPCFGGPKNLPMLLNELYAGDEDRCGAYLRSYQKCYDDLPRLLSPEALRAAEKLPPLEELVRPFLERASMSQYLNRLMLLNTRLKGADHILTKVSNLTQAHGLVGQSPLFDCRVVAEAFATPPQYKLAGSEEKMVLKRAVADLLPEPILTRPKSGMLVPVQDWFRRDLRRYARAMLLARNARTRPYLNRSLVREWLEYRGGLWPRHGVKLWLLLTLEVWLRVQE
ncbi:MAG: asparagine synthetase B family protein, partial [Actinomycetota bacterium]